MEVSRRTDYAIRMLLDLARSDGAPISARTLAERQDVPYAFARGIGSELVSAGMVESRRGASGGFVLVRDRADLSLLEIIETMQGPILCSVCTSDPDWCRRMGGCNVHHVWSGADEVLKEYLGSKSLAGLIESEEGR